jgi:hypothetical protein
MDAVATLCHCSARARSNATQRCGACCARAGLYFRNRCSLCCAWRCVPTMQEDCAGADVRYTFTWPQPSYASTEYDVTFEATIPQQRNIALAKDSGTNMAYHVPHANIHSCLRKVGFCTPFVANTPELATHSAALVRNVTTVGEVAFESQISLEALDCALPSPIRFFLL